jgi:hypothetical protein
MPLCLPSNSDATDEEQCVTRLRTGRHDVFVSFFKQNVNQRL